MRRFINCKTVAIALAMLHFSCSDSDDASPVHDPGRPVTITDFMPDSGRINEKFIIKGSNFGTDISKIHVFFNNKEAQTLSSSGNVIYALVPRSPGENCTIKVKIDEQEEIFKERTYKYIVSTSVTTLLGKLNPDGSTDQKDGTFAQTMLKFPYFVTVDKDNNLFIFEGDDLPCAWARVRMANEQKDQVVTLAQGDLVNSCFQPLMTPDQQTIYVPVITKATILIMEKRKGWIPKIFIDFNQKKYEHLKKVFQNKYIHSIALDDEGYLYVRTNQADVVKINPADKSAVKLPNKIGNGGQNGYMVFNPLDGWIYCTLHIQNKIVRFSKDGNTIEDFAGSGTQGFADGVKENAKFSWPRGIAIDKEGNLYVADQTNHRIRKITTPDGVVTTCAGTGKAGWKDGIPEEAQFNQPWGVCIDNDGAILVGDLNNHRIRKVAIE